MRPMKRSLMLCLVAAGVGLALAGAVAAQTTPTVGAVVHDSDGKPVGVIEKVVVQDGAPRQVQVRDGRVLRTLPIRGLIEKDGGLFLLLSKAEFLALPVVE